MVNTTELNEKILKDVESLSPEEKDKFNQCQVKVKEWIAKYPAIETPDMEIARHLKYAYYKFGDVIEKIVHETFRTEFTGEFKEYLEAQHSGNSTATAETLDGQIMNKIEAYLSSRYVYMFNRSQKPIKGSTGEFVKVVLWSQDPPLLVNGSAFRDGVENYLAMEPGKAYKMSLQISSSNGKHVATILSEPHATPAPNFVLDNKMVVNHIMNSESYRKIDAGTLESLSGKYKELWFMGKVVSNETNSGFRLYPSSFATDKTIMMYPPPSVKLYDGDIVFGLSSWAPPKAREGYAPINADFIMWPSVVVIMQKSITHIDEEKKDAENKKLREESKETKESGEGKESQEKADKDIPAEF